MLIRSELGDDGVLLATIDMPERTMNVFSFALMDALEALIDDVNATPNVRSVVITSGKSSFLAGADLVMVRGFTEPGPDDTPDVMFERCGRLGRLFLRVEESAKPWVAAVNGTALGGGLELAMACRARLVADDPRALIGLPEVRWGLLPGAGGTQRLPRFVGFEEGMSMLLTGRAVSPRRAAEMKIFDGVVAPQDLLAEARLLALGLLGRAPDNASKFPDHAQTDVPAHSQEETRRVARAHGVSDADFDRYPAHGAIIDSVLLGARKPLAEATNIEMRQFLRLMFDPVAGNMVRTLFLNRQRADREMAAPRELRIERILLGPLSATRRAWQEAVGASKLVQASDATLPPDTASITDTQGCNHRVALRTLDDAKAAQPFDEAAAVLSPTGPYGRVLEIVAKDDATAQALAAVAARLGALPCRSRGNKSALLQLAAAGDARTGGPALDAQSLAAMQLFADGDVTDPELLDVAACTAGIAPAFSGGPFTHLWQQRSRLTACLSGPAADAWPALEQKLAKAYP
ncbi:enoyl-CoA hydratase/isomerase family protein [Variovorax sp. LjRoot290]|uniref:enoyl-CoA hydratase/isomerase family protein n=1 Tax=unclassified Variovorax TaxID=663243 RepID=UPI003ECF6F31